jgi:hypothetical protein
MATIFNPWKDKLFAIGDWSSLCGDALNVFITINFYCLLSIFCSQQSNWILQGRCELLSHYLFPFPICILVPFNFSLDFLAVFLWNHKDKFEFHWKVMFHISYMHKVAWNYKVIEVIIFCN